MDIAKKSGGKETLIQIIKILIKNECLKVSLTVAAKIFVYIRRVYKSFSCLMIYDLFVYPFFLYLYLWTILFHNMPVL